MCTLCLSDMGELRDEWLREPKAARHPALPPGLAPSPTAVRELTVVAASIPAPRAALPPASLRLASVA